MPNDITRTSNVHVLMLSNITRTYSDIQCILAQPGLTLCNAATVFHGIPAWILQIPERYSASLNFLAPLGTTPENLVTEVYYVRTEAKTKRGGILSCQEKSRGILLVTTWGWLFSWTYLDQQIMWSQNIQIPNSFFWKILVPYRRWRRIRFSQRVGFWGFVFPNSNITLLKQKMPEATTKPQR